MKGERSTVDNNELLQKKEEELLKKLEEYYHLKDKLRDVKPGKDVIQHAGPYLRKEEFIAAIQALLKEWLVQGESAKKFEQIFCKLVGHEFGIVTNSGSSANLLMVAALKSKKTYNFQSGKIITPAFCFPTTLNPIIQNGFTPVFADVTLDDYNIDVNQLENIYDKDCKAIFFSHTFGIPANMDEIMKFVEDHNLVFLEDNCDALGSKYKDKPTGSFGVMSSCSFYPAHHMTMGEGGFVACSNENLANTIRSLRDWGRGCYCVGKKANESKVGTCGHRFDNWINAMPDKIFDHKYVYGEIGFNLKPLELQCAMGLEQIKRLEQFTKKREYNFNSLYSFFKKFEKYFILPNNNDPKKQISWFGFILTIKDSSLFSREKICEFYEDNKIATRTFFGGNVLLHPAYEGIVDFKDAMNNFPVSTKITNDSFYIGLHPSIEEKHLNWIKDVTERFFEKY
jgi:CDP-4-dehydro-6-deoxyglucose reductase, E1